MAIIQDENLTISGGDLVITTTEGETAARIASTGRLKLFESGTPDQPAVLELAPADARLTIGSEVRPGELAVVSGADATIELNAFAAKATIGAADAAGIVVVTAEDASETVRIGGADARLRLGITGQAGNIEVRDQLDRPALEFDAGGAELRVGAENDDDGTNAGNVIVRGQLGRDAIHLDGSTATITAGGNGNEGDVIVTDGNGFTAIHANGGDGTLTVGAGNVDGIFVVRDRLDRQTVRIGGADARLRLGITGQAGNIEVRDQLDRPALEFDAGSAELRLGAESDDDGVNAGNVIVRGIARTRRHPSRRRHGHDHRRRQRQRRRPHRHRRQRVHGDPCQWRHRDAHRRCRQRRRQPRRSRPLRLASRCASTAPMECSRSAATASRVTSWFAPPAASTPCVLNGETAELFLGSDGVEGDLIVRDVDGVDRIRLNGANGDIELMGADLAEEFACARRPCPGDGGRRSRRRRGRCRMPSR